MTTTIQVSNATELTAALKSAAAGDIISLAAGDYGDLKMNRVNFSSDVTITSNDPDNPAVFKSIYLSGSSHIVFDSIQIEKTPTETSTYLDKAINIVGGSSYITVSNSTIHGGPALSGVDPSATKLDSTKNVVGYPTGTAVAVMDAEHVTFTNNSISEFFTGINFTNAKHLNVSNNEIFDLRTTPLRGGNVSDVIVDSNHFHSSNPWNFGGTGDHGDYIHFWTRAGYQDGASDHLVITNNVFQAGDGHSLLGIYLDDNGANLGFTNVEVSDNIIQTGNAQAIRFENVNGADITNNSLIQNAGDSGDNPSMLFTDKTTNITIDKNIMGNLNIQKEAGDPSTFHVGDNYFVQGHDPAGQNYVGDLFVNGLSPSASLYELSAIPGSVLASGGYGSHMTNFASYLDHPVGYVNVGEGELPVEKSFDLHMFDLGGEVDLARATVVWDFGDGVKEKGLDVTHIYHYGGTYDVTATIMVDGESYIVSKSIGVHDFRIATLSAADLMNSSDVQWSGAYASTSDTLLVKSSTSFASSTDSGSDMVQFDKSTYATLAANAATVGMDNLFVEFGISFDEQISTRFRPVWNHQHFGVEVNGEKVSLILFKEDGTADVISGKVPSLQDGSYHKMTFSYDSETGKAYAMMDGEVFASAGGLSGSLSEKTATSTYIGGTPWGDNFVGKMDGVTILNASENPVLPDYDGVVNYPVDEVVVPEVPVDIQPDLSPLYSLDQVLASLDSTFVKGSGDNSYFAFDGSGYASLGREESFFNHDAMTISFDMRTNGANETTSRLLWNHTRYGLELKGDDLSFRFSTDNGSSYTIVAKDTGINDLDWHNVGITLDSTNGTASAYVDGILVGTVENVSGSIGGVASWDMTVGGTPWGRNFDGDIAHLKIYDVAEESLVAHSDTAEDVSSSADAGSALIDTVIEDTSLVADGQTESSPSADDQPSEQSVSSDEIDGAIIAAIEDAGDGLDVIQSTSSLYGDAMDTGSSLKFSGNGYASIGRPSDMMTMDEFTLSLDVKPDLDNSGSTRLFWAHGRYGIELKGDDLYLSISTNTGEGKSIKIMDTNILDGDWHQITMSYDSTTGTLKGYFDGALSASMTGIQGEIGNPNEWDITIGGTPWGRYFKGEIDNVRVWGEAIEPTDTGADFSHDAGEGLTYDPADFWSGHMHDADLLLNLR